MKQTKQQLDTASYNFFRCKFNELNETNKKWILDQYKELEKRR